MDMFRRLKAKREDSDRDSDRDKDRDKDKERERDRFRDRERERDRLRQQARRSPPDPWMNNYGGGGYFGSTEDKEEEEVVDPSGYRFKFVNPLEWHIPAMVQPVEDTTEQSTTSGNLGVISTDAQLYTLPERTTNNTIINHSVLKMPSTLPSGNTPSSNTFNILMADVSGSMNGYWVSVQNHWNSFVAPKLVGESRIFTFDNSVKFRRCGTELCDGDFSGGGTELTGALQTIVSEVYTCQQKYVNIFIITGGDHNGSSVSPQTVIDQMEAPSRKVCSIYLLGAGHNFPVQYSIDIRSRLHNGNSNLPSLYWAKQSVNIMEQMEDIGTKVSGGSALTMKLNVVGSPLPGLEPRDTFHLEELVYFPDGPENYQELNVNVTGSTGQIKLRPREISTEDLFGVFRQWNSIIIQLKFKKERIPDDVIPFMERLFNSHANKPKPEGPQSLSERLRDKDNKREEMEFRSLLNGIKGILTHEKFDKHIDLAESILKTSVTRSKYETKTLQLKGHTDSEYEEDCKAFMDVYNQHKESILNLEVTEEDRCRVSSQSTLSDLQDQDFHLLMDKNKFEFLKAFTLSGIPVFAPTRDSVTLNPWSFSVQRIVSAPYTIMSQVAMETMAQNSTDNVNKEVQAKGNDDATNFNAIIPVFPPSAANTLQPIVRTRLYAMCVTFATLKNPHMIDFNVHMASLGVTWVRCLFENPTTPRPEHVRIRMDSIEATAACYMDRPGFATYARILQENTPQALMTESIETYGEGKTIKCESIIKPMFILRMLQFIGPKIEISKVADIVKVMLLEYVGRCIKHYQSEDVKTPYTDFFAESLDDQERKKSLVQKFVADSKSELSQYSTGLLNTFYTFEQARKAAQTVAKGRVECMQRAMSAEIPAKVNMEKVKQLRNLSSAGDLSWGTLQVFAREVGLDDDAINTLFSEESVFVYTAHALRYRSSKDRLKEVVDDYETCKIFVTKQIQEENLNILSKQLYASLVSALEDAWLKEYLDVHTEVVEPMTPQQIVHQAQLRGIQVTEDTFSQVYKRYRPVYGLLGNACQTRACPYYLQPKKTYNQHASVERSRGTTPFMHALHQTTYECRENELVTTVSEITSGKNTREKKPIPEGEVAKWKPDINKLKNTYSEQAKGKLAKP